MNGFGHLITRILREKGLSRSDLARRMVRAGWDIDNPQDAIRYAFRKKSPTLNFEILHYAAIALNLSERQEDEILHTAYRSITRQQRVLSLSYQEAGDRDGAKSSSLMPNTVSS